MVTKAGKTVAKKQSAVSAAKVRGAAAKMARDASKKEVTPAAEWKKPSKGVELEVPSGNVALVRPVGMQAFLQKGIVPNSLRDIAMEAISGKKPAPQMKMDGMSPEKIEDMLTLFDSVTCYCVIEPKVTPVPMDTIVHPADDKHDGFWEETRVIPVESRDPEKLYVDEVNLDDKIFIFQFACGGTRSVEQFREEFSLSMDALSGGQNLEENSE